MGFLKKISFYFLTCCFFFQVVSVLCIDDFVFYLHSFNFQVRAVEAPYNLKIPFKRGSLLWSPSSKLNIPEEVKFSYKKYNFVWCMYFDCFKLVSRVCGEKRHCPFSVISSGTSEHFTSMELLSQDRHLFD